MCSQALDLWFKLDRASESGIERGNGIRRVREGVGESPLLCAGSAPTLGANLLFQVRW
ncbi:MAG: hypothetical protein IPJ48_19125 [Propionivibrio sp.]|uniref:Uncharacterized protein n=1 Tax=Candidatus Propionivibrio dominans TaxID=2954373 RepID=A0A9D7IAB2_9RHOO|nr:hypothetical protein [Candidatus Propionivibrio dominans]